MAGLDFVQFPACHCGKMQVCFNCFPRHIALHALLSLHRHLLASADTYKISLPQMHYCKTVFNADIGTLPDAIW